MGLPHTLTEIESKHFLFALTPGASKGFANNQITFEVHEKISAQLSATKTEFGCQHKDSMPNLDDGIS